MKVLKKLSRKLMKEGDEQLPWVLHGAGTSLSCVEHATKLGKGLKALEKLEQTLGLSLVGRTRTPEILASCSQDSPATGDGVPPSGLTMSPGLS